MRWMLLFIAVTTSAQMQSSVQWEVSFEYSQTVDFAETTPYPIALTVPFEYDNGFVRVVAKKVEVEDMKKTLLALMSMVLTNSQGDLIIMPAVIKGNVVTAQQGTLPDLNITQPTNVYPEAFATFSPAVNPGTYTNSIIAEWTRSVPTARSMFYTSESDVTNWIVYASAGTGSTAPDSYYTSGYGRATMPSGSGSRLMWPEYGGLIGTPVVANAAQLHWIGPERVANSEQFVLHGENLAVGGVGYALIEGYGWVTNSSGDEFRLVFDVPDDLSAGPHTIHAHNGTGKKYGWGGSDTITVADLYDYTTSTNSVTAGSFSDFLTKYATASAGTTIYVPDGTYQVTTSVTGKSGVRILCQSTNAVFVCDSTFPASGIMFNFNGTQNARIDNMTIDGGDVTPEPGYLLYANGYNCRFNGCRITQENYATKPVAGYAINLEGHDGNPVWLENSTIIWARRSLIKSYVNFTSNLVYGIWYDQSFVKGDSGVNSIRSEVAFNEFHNLADGVEATSSQGRIMNYQHALVALHSFYGNESFNYKPYKFDNTGEQWMIEVGDTKVIASVSSATSDTLTAPYFTSGTWANNCITIREGPGMGQTRLITAVDTGTGTATVDRPWNVVPDATSVYSVQEGAFRCIIASNTFDGIADGLNTASSGVSFWGAANNNIVANNVINETEGGVSLWAFVSDVSPIVSEACYFNLISSNNVANMAGHYLGGDGYGAYAYDLVKYGGRSSAYTPVVGALGNIFRDSIIDTAYSGMNIGGDNTTFSTEGTVFEYNTGSATNIFTAGQGVNTYTNGNTLIDL